jgi:hypothetical protein
VPAGSQTAFNYSSGQTANGKLGSAAATGSGFYFTPINFIASSTGSGGEGAPVNPSSSSDTLSVILTAKPNQMFTSISSSLLGDFSIFGVGQVNATGALKVTNLDTSSTLTSPLAFNNLPASTATSADGGWDGGTSLALPAGWTNIRVELDSTLTADGSSSGVAFIQAKDGDIGVVTAEVPLPAAALVAPVLGYIGWRAKKRFAK